MQNGCSLVCSAFLLTILCQNGGLWQAVHASTHFHAYPTIVGDFALEIVLFDNVVGAAPAELWAAP